MSLASETAAYLNLSPLSSNDFSASSPVTGSTVSSSFNNTSANSAPTTSSNLLSNSVSQLLNTAVPGLSGLQALPGFPSGLGGSASSASSTGLFDFLSEFFLRAVIVITGFIFVAVGLSMFKTGKTVISTVKKAIA